MSAGLHMDNNNILMHLSIIRFLHACIHVTYEVGRNNKIKMEQKLF